ncbi:MAG TPA: PD-(D/E)XK nuclease family protein [Acidobacteriaceae bacterium]
MSLATQLADALRRGATIIAASARTARVLQRLCAEDQRAAGREVWPAPPILDWDAWLRELWRDYAFITPDAPVLLTSLQEQVLWTVVQREDADLVLSPHAMAAQAMEAWELLSDYRAHGARASVWEATDAERFRQWAARFEHACERNGWISASRLAAPLAGSADIALPAEVCLAGFDRVTPAQRAFLGAMADRGVVLSELELQLQIPARRWIMARDVREEISACAVWARDLLLENPAVRIGIIVPSVAGLRGTIDRVFRSLLMPTSEDIRTPAASMPWEFSLGQPLADVPAIRAALLQLRWIAETLPEEEISWLLLSGFVSDTATNSAATARYDAMRRRRGTAHVSLLPQRSLAEFADSLAARSDRSALGHDLTALLQATAANHILDQPRQPSAWADLVHHLLDRAAWPGRRAPESVLFQALQRWQRLLDDLALLDFDGRRYSYNEFLGLLGSHARETIFAPESRDAPIQITGPFESSGQEFDALWFLSADDSRWPQRGRLHPLLPPGIQRQFGMPHSTPEHDWNLAHRVTTRLLASAPRVVFSFARHEIDVELRPSPLAASLFPGDALPESANTLRFAGEPANLESIPEAAPLPWPQERNAGGADVLRRQSACPFQAFAVKRLAAEPMEAVEWGFDPAEKGNILHQVLQLFFRAVRTRDDLVAAITANRLDAELAIHIDAVLDPYGSSDPWQQSYVDAEKRRLRARLTEWLAIEAQRHPFRVEAREDPRNDVHVGALRLNLRADRIDVLADGSRLLIDYKTGEASPASWRSDRPDEPQLLLYAAYGNVADLSGVVFAKIRAGKTGFDGRMRDARGQLCANIGTRSGLVTEPYSEKMRDDWAAVLVRLAEQFLAGDAAVDPREPAVCKQCDLHSLCRIAELNRAASADDTGEDADA